MIDQDALDIADQFPLPQFSSTQKLTHGMNTYSALKKMYNKSSSKYANHEYTFTPKTNRQGNKRSFDKFIQSQQSFLKNRECKINRMKAENIKKQLHHQTNVPKINHNYEYHQRKDVFHRLSHRKPKMETQIGEEESFVPHILNKSKSMKRKQKVEELLYSDAERRKKQQKFLEEELVRKSPQFPEINSNTTNHVCQKLRQQFQELVGDQETLPPIMVISIIGELFNVDLNPNKGESSEQLCHQVLTYLMQSNQGEIQVLKLWNFILCILGHEINYKYFTEEEKAQIHTNLSYFYSRRLTKQRKTPSHQRLSFQPDTLKASDKLAQNHRQKVLTQISDFLESNSPGITVGDTLKIQDLYILDSIRRKADLQTKKVLKDQKEIQNCSFRPSIERIKVIQRSPRKSCYSDRSQTKKSKINEDSVQKKKEKQNIKKEGKKIVLKGKQKNEQLSQVRQNIKDTEKAIMRMEIGRKIREYSQKVLDRGYPSNIVNWIEYQKQQKNIIEQEDQKLKGYRSKEKIGNYRA